MGDISVLERRISAALARIAQAADAIASQDNQATTRPAASDEEIDQLRLDLVAAQTQVAAQETHITDQSSEVAELKLTITKQQNDFTVLADAIDGLERGLDRLRQSNAQLRNANTDLRTANANGLGDADLINAGLSASLETLKAERAVDKTQIDHLMNAMGVAEQEANDA